MNGVVELLKQLYNFNMENIENLSIGDFFKRKEGAKKTYTRGSYNRAMKAYECQNWEDINDYVYIKKGKKVFTDFEF